MKRSGIGFALCMGIVLSFMAGKMSAYAGEEGRELQTSSSNIASTHGTQFFSAGADYGYFGETPPTGKIVIDGIQLREPLKDVMPNTPRDRMRVKDLDLRGKNLKLKIHRKGDAPNQFINVDDISISSLIYYNKMTGESDYERYTERAFTPGDYFYGIELTTRNKNYRFEAGLRNYFSLESSYGETAESRTPLTYRFLFKGDIDEGNQLKLYFFEKNNYLVEEDYPFKEIRMFLPEKDLQYGKLGDEVPHTTWSKMGDGLLDGNGEETETEVSIPHKGENKVNCEYALEDVSRGGYYGSGSKITRPGTYRRVLRDFTLKMNSISHYRLTFGGVDGSLVTKFYINDKEWKIDPRTASLDSIDPVTGSLKVTLYDPDYITLRGAGGSTGGSSHSGGSYSGGSSSGGGSYSGGGSGGGGSSAIFSGSPAGQVLGADRSLSNGEWVKDEKGWWYKRQDGSYPKNTWGYESYNGKSYWYYFLDSGYMATGWVDLNGSKYYLFPGSDGWMGRMLTGWQWIDGYCYYFGTDSGNNEGHLYRNEKTSDGYRVDNEGRWVENGVLQAKK